MRYGGMLICAVIGSSGCMNLAREAADLEQETSQPSATVAPAPPPAAKPAPEGWAGGGQGFGGLQGVPPAQPHHRSEQAPVDSSADDEIDGKGAHAPMGPAPRRMVHYNGYLKLKVANPTVTLQQASEIGDAAGGYVEQLTSTTVTLRVPVARFREVYEALAKIGDVLSRSMTAEDVTQKFVALELRVKTLRASRERLIHLLAKASKARDKLTLLREIQRLTEQIDQLDMHLGTIASLAALSRLTVEVVPHQVHIQSSSEEPIGAFRWIHELSPFRRDIAIRGDRLEFEVPEGMVELGGDIWMAESADGARIWASRQQNIPEGDTDFWSEALRVRLAPEYGSADLSLAGPFEVLRLVDHSERAYRYLIGLRVVGDRVLLVEAYYPSEEHEKRYDAALRSVIAKGAR